MSALTAKDLEAFRKLPSLKLTEPDSLAVLKESPEIQVLSLHHFTKIHSLQPLGTLRNLRALFMSRTPGWDGTSRHLLVESFEPLAELQKLETIQILGVIPKRGRLEPLGRIPSLRRLSIGNSIFYQLEDFAALSAALPRARDSLRPIYQMNFVTICRRCRKHPQLFLAGSKPRSPRYVCPACDRKKLISHLQRWNNAGGLPAYDSPDRLSTADFFERFGNPDAT